MRACAACTAEAARLLSDERSLLAARREVLKIVSGGPLSSIYT
jgi:hypothetical protein